MKFGSATIPEELFEIASNVMLSAQSFKPEEIRLRICSDAKTIMASVNQIERNHWIIANRVMRHEIKSLTKEGRVRQLKRGV
jgi:hypothetical protein